MNTPGLPSHFFSFPLDNITYPVAIDPFSESNRLTKVVEEYPPEVEMIRYAPKSKFVGVNADGSFNKTYPGTTVIQSSVSLSKVLFRQKQTGKFFKSIGMGKKDIEWNRWYEVCIPSLFQPSSFSMRFIKPFLDRLKGHFVIGIHIRMAGNYSLWGDSTEYLSMDNLIKKMSDIDMELMSHQNAMIFLATDSILVEQQFVEKYSNRVLMANYLPQTLSGKKSNEAGLMRMLIELVILGNSNVLFLTSQSTFSRVALAMNGIAQKVVYF